MPASHDEPSGKARMAGRVVERLGEMGAAVRERAGRKISIIESLTITQQGRYVDLRFSVADGITPRSVWARNSDSETWVLLSDVSPDNGTHSARIDLLQLPATRNEDGTTVSFCLEIERNLRANSKAAQALAENAEAEILPAERAGHVVVRYRYPLGRARYTDVGCLTEVVDDHVRVIPYVNSRGRLSATVDRPLNPFGSVHVSRLMVRRGVMHMRGRLNTRHGEVLAAEFLLKGRTSGQRIVRPVRLKFDPERTAAKFGQRWHSFGIEMDCADLLADPLFVDDIFDAWLRLRTAQDDDVFEIRVGRTRLLTRYLTRSGWADRDGRAVAVSPYYTFKAKRTSFNVNIFDARDFAYLRRQVRLRHVVRALNWRRDIWLIGERPQTAQDNGYWFFRYLREQHPEVNAYYVIRANSPDRAKVDVLGNVVEHGSREHIRLTLLARKIVGSHHPDFLFPVRTKEFNRAVRATRVFLQHGVMGTKWMASLYGKFAPGFESDLVIVSSAREREYIITDFGYSSDQVAVTGLPRFDSLFADDVAPKPRQILVMPTWRDWLQDREIYIESDYHRTWSDLLHDPALRALVEQHHLEIVLCLHANMSQYQHLFDDVPARVVAQGDEDVQRLLKESAMLVTDYSSVGFDFSFLHKPVIYFQFDREQFLAPRGSHLDLDEELPGPILRSPVSVLAEMRAQVKNGFTMGAGYPERAERFLVHHDRANSERVYEAVLHARRDRNFLQRTMKNELLSAVPRVLRRHRLYFPVMRRVFTLLKLLPADRNLVLFESGLGKQYADAPRYIYENLIRTHPELKKVWVYSGRLPVADPNTRVVQRLSPAYYYYLARAHRWVNNQSFPHYIRRRGDGVFVQTWHGTPVKRMAHDISEVHGRDGGYLKRATAAAAQWTLLVSPNSYTTDIMRSAFRYEGDVLEVGYPRNDVLHRPDRDQRAAQIRSRLGIKPGQRVVLYAPTFRDNQVRAGRFAFELPFDLDRIQQELGDDTVLLLRMHVLIGGRVDIPAHLRDHIRDESRYPDVQDLLLISDVLITDYSSLYFDYASLRRPILFYAYDLASYRDKLRGFYLDYEKEAPGPILQTEDELAFALRHLDAAVAGSDQRREAFLERFCAADDGHAAERVVEAVFGPGLEPSRPTEGPPSA